MFSIALHLQLCALSACVCVVVHILADLLVLFIFDVYSKILLHLCAMHTHTPPAKLYSHTQNANKVDNQFSTPYKISYVLTNWVFVLSSKLIHSIDCLLLDMVFFRLLLLLSFDGAILIWIHFCDSIKARIIFAPCQRCNTPAATTHGNILQLIKCGAYQMKCHKNTVSGHATHFQLPRSLARNYPFLWMAIEI